MHLAVDTPGHPVALHVTPADADDLAEVDRLTGAVQAGTDASAEKAFVDQGYWSCLGLMERCRLSRELRSMPHTRPPYGCAT